MRMTTLSTLSMVLFTAHLAQTDSITDKVLREPKSEHIKPCS